MWQAVPTRFHRATPGHPVTLAVGVQQHLDDLRITREFVELLSATINVLIKYVVRYNCELSKKKKQNERIDRF